MLEKKRIKGCRGPLGELSPKLGRATRTLEDQAVRKEVKNGEDLSKDKDFGEKQSVAKEMKYEDYV